VPARRAAIDLADIPSRRTRRLPTVERKPISAVDAACASAGTVQRRAPARLDELGAHVSGFRGVPAECRPRVQPCLRAESEE